MTGYCPSMRLVLLGVLVASTAFAGGGHHFGARAQLGGATWSGGLGPSWGPATPSWVNTRSGPTPLVPVTNYTAGAGQYYPYGGGYPIYYYYPTVTQAQPAPQQPQVIIEREVIVERAAVADPPPAPAPAPQVIVIQQPAPTPPPAPVAPPPPPEPQKPVGPRTPGPDVYSWVDADGVVNYSTRAPASGNVKAKKLATLGK